MKFIGGTSYFENEKEIIALPKAISRRVIVKVRSPCEFCIFLTFPFSYKYYWIVDFTHPSSVASVKTRLVLNFNLNL